MDQKDIKQTVKEKYSQIAMQSKQENESSCCGATGCCSGVDYTIFSENYNQVKGYNADADLGLGCGIPTEYAKIKEGDTVVDLGSGAGNDCFVARAIVGEYGKVVGIDMTEAMISKARENAKKLNYSNVEFMLGDIESMPINAKVADVVISNCVLNLVPNKQKAFEEIYRILKNGGHFSISDVVIKGELPEKIKQAAEMYAGCVAGAIDKDEYIGIIERTGFVDVTIQKEKQITVPDEVLLNFLNETELRSFKEAGTGIFSITVYGRKPKGCGCGCSC
ncbi:MAG TPA: arsenite methyltransferase [Tenuifilaceae bacterium]|nr:arsenite methyltransferase [Tenuifilaceae bacterium]HOZ15930.1 arsenite methyltransferase [Tenuifilaceae bacterium]HPI45545.1 arsenite methyltransferase [Tenuifilaceae bacterium]HPN22282.1 arsenite methyltransferase [Tenuifilaceae bacterium]HPV57575.1 arsenite methyltransferase [Tenuifilaceae bacterium]